MADNTTTATPVPEPALMSVGEAAAYLGISVSGLRAKASASEVESIKVGGLVKFRRSGLDAYIERCARPAINRPRQRKGRFG